MRNHGFHGLTRISPRSALLSNAIHLLFVSLGFNVEQFFFYPCQSVKSVVNPSLWFRRHRAKSSVVN
jgi:hypothetical protein